MIVVPRSRHRRKKAVVPDPSWSTGFPDREFERLDDPAELPEPGMADSRRIPEPEACPVSPAGEQALDP
jgi:hypothetical protein